MIGDYRIEKTVQCPKCKGTGRVVEQRAMGIEWVGSAKMVSFASDWQTVETDCNRCLGGYRKVYVVITLEELLAEVKENTAKITTGD